MVAAQALGLLAWDAAATFLLNSAKPVLVDHLGALRPEAVGLFVEGLLVTNLCSSETHKAMRPTEPRKSGASRPPSGTATGFCGLVVEQQPVELHLCLSQLLPVNLYTLLDPTKRAPVDLQGVLRSGGSRTKQPDVDGSTQPLCSPTDLLQDPVGISQET